MPAVRDQHHVAVAHLGQDVDRPVGLAVHPLVGHPAGVLARQCAVRTVADLVVVDLLEHALPLPRGVVLVRRVGGPVSPGGEHLAGDQVVGVERVGGAEVVHLAAALPGAAQLHRDALGRSVARGQPPLAPRGGYGEAAALLAGHGDLRVARDVGEVGDAGEHRLAPGQREPLAVAGHRARTAQRQHERLRAAGLEGGRASGWQPEHPQAAELPAGVLGRDRQRPGRARGRAGRLVQPGAGVGGARRHRGITSSARPPRPRRPGRLRPGGTARTGPRRGPARRGARARGARWRTCRSGRG